MNFLKSGWNSVVGSNESSNQPSVADTIEKLIERVETSTLLEDRRDACRALKSLAKTYRLEVGAQGMEALINVLLTDTHDNEIISYTLDALCYIITGPQEDPNDYEGIQSPKEDTEDIGIQFTEIFAKKKENVAILIDLLSEFDFKVRWPALKLLTGLLRNKLRYIQDLVLEKASGIPKIMDLLADSREIIRNDAILLLVHLTRSNPNIQKIVTFENAFDKLFDIIASEGFTDGGVVVEDCLIVCQYLLKNNTSNQIFFREGNYLLKLLPFLDISDYISWCPQKETNVLFLLYMIRTLVSPTNPANITAPVQKTILQCGLFSKLCEMLLIKGIPEIVLSETINTVGEAIRGDNFNQKYFYNINTLVDPPKPIMVVLLMSMINEKQSFILRCAILYCFQCFLYKNEFGQAQIIQTLLPSTIEASEDINVGQLLCSGLFSQDSISQWFVTVALSHLLIDNKAQKEQLLRVQIATDVNSTPIPLFISCCTLLQESTKFHSKLGLLILLSTWLSNCTFAVIRFLEITTNVPFLISQITLGDEGDDCDMLIHGMCAFLLGICIKYNDDSVPNFTKEDMVQLLNKRIGIDSFIDKINKISNHETYSATLQKPFIKFKTIDDVVLDHEFCKLFKSLENDIVKLVRMKPGDQSNPESSLTDEQHKLLVQYKSLIRDQDLQITLLRKEKNDLLDNNVSLQNELKEMNANLNQLKDELALIKQTYNLMNSPSSQDNFPVSSLSTNFSQMQMNLPQDNNYNNNKVDYAYNNPYNAYSVNNTNHSINNPSLTQASQSQPLNHQSINSASYQFYSYPNHSNYSPSTNNTVQQQAQTNNSLDLQSGVNSQLLQSQSSSSIAAVDSHGINLQSNNLHSNQQASLNQYAQPAYQQGDHFGDQQQKYQNHSSQISSQQQHQNQQVNISQLNQSPSPQQQHHHQQNANVDANVDVKYYNQYLTQSTNPVQHSNGLSSDYSMNNDNQESINLKNQVTNDLNQHY